MVHVFVGFIHGVVDRINTYRGWQINLSLWLHVDIKLFSYDLSSCTCFAVELQL